MIHVAVCTVQGANSKKVMAAAAVLKQMDNRFMENAQWRFVHRIKGLFTAESALKFPVNYSHSIPATKNMGTQRLVRELSSVSVGQKKGRISHENRSRKSKAREF